MQSIFRILLRHSAADGQYNVTTKSCLFDSSRRGLFTVLYIFLRSFRYTASYRHGYLDFEMYGGGGVASEGGKKNHDG